MIEAPSEHQIRSPHVVQISANGSPPLCPLNSLADQQCFRDAATSRAKKRKAKGTIISMSLFSVEMDDLLRQGSWEDLTKELKYDEKAGMNSRWFDRGKSF